jgi:hypothetical protein
MVFFPCLSLDSMDTPEHVFFGRIRDMSLSAHEEKCTWSSLAAFMKAHPIEEARPRQALWSAQNVFERVGTFLHACTFRPAIAFVTVLVLCITSFGITAFAAEFSQPGDVLYTFKVRLVEEVIGTVLSVSAEAEAEWHVDRIGRRLEEAGFLASANALDQDDALWIVERVGDRTEEVLALALNLASAGKENHAEDVVSGLEASLHAGSRNLTYFSKNPITQRTRRNLGLIATELRRAEDEVTLERVFLEENIVADLHENPGILQEEVQEAEQSIGEAIAGMEEARASSDMLSEAQSKIESAQDILLEARNNMGMNHVTLAFLQASTAERLADETRELLKLQ